MVFTRIECEDCKKMMSGYIDGDTQVVITICTDCAIKRCEKIKPN